MECINSTEVISDCLKMDVTNKPKISVLQFYQADKIFDDISQRNVITIKAASAPIDFATALKNVNEDNSVELGEEAERRKVSKSRSLLNGTKFGKDVKVKVKKGGIGGIKKPKIPKSKTLMQSKKLKVLLNQDELLNCTSFKNQKGFNQISDKPLVKSKKKKNVNKDAFLSKSKQVSFDQIGDKPLMKSKKKKNVSNPKQNVDQIGDKPLMKSKKKKNVCNPKQNVDQIGDKPLMKSKKKKNVNKDVFLSKSKQSFDQIGDKPLMKSKKKKNVNKDVLLGKSEQESSNQNCDELLMKSDNEKRDNKDEFLSLLDLIARGSHSNSKASETGENELQKDDVCGNEVKTKIKTTIAKKNRHQGGKENNTVDKMLQKDKVLENITESDQKIDNSNLDKKFNSGIKKKIKKGVNKNKLLKVGAALFGSKTKTSVKLLKKEIPVQEIGPRCMCGANSGMKCNELTEESRNEIFSYVQSIEQVERASFVKDTVKKYLPLKDKSPQQPKESESLSVTNVQHFNYLYSLKVGEEYLKVCRKLFLSTTGLTDKFVRARAHSLNEPKVTEYSKDMKNVSKPSKRISAASAKKIKKRVDNFSDEKSDKVFYYDTRFHMNDQESKVLKGSKERERDSENKLSVTRIGKRKCNLRKSFCEKEIVNNTQNLKKNTKTVCNSKTKKVSQRLRPGRSQMKSGLNDKKGAIGEPDDFKLARRRSKKKLCSCCIHENIPIAGKRMVKSNPNPLTLAKAVKVKYTRQQKIVNDGQKLSSVFSNQRKYPKRSNRSIELKNISYKSLVSPALRAMPVCKTSIKNYKDEGIKTEKEEQIFKNINKVCEDPAKDKGIKRRLRNSQDEEELRIDEMSDPLKMKVKEEKKEQQNDFISLRNGKKKRKIEDNSETITITASKKEEMKGIKKVKLSGSVKIEKQDGRNFDDQNKLELTKKGKDLVKNACSMANNGKKVVTKQKHSNEKETVKSKNEKQKKSKSKLSKLQEKEYNDNVMKQILSVLQPGQLLPERCVCQPPEFHCCKITEEERFQISRSISFLTWPERVQFVLNTVSKIYGKNKKDAILLNADNVHYFLNVDGKRLKVCSHMYTSTTGLCLLKSWGLSKHYPLNDNKNAAVQINPGKDVNTSRDSMIKVSEMQDTGGKNIKSVCDVIKFPSAHVYSTKSEWCTSGFKAKFVKKLGQASSGDDKCDNHLLTCKIKSEAKGGDDNCASQNVENSGNYLPCCNCYKGVSEIRSKTMIVNYGEDNYSLSKVKSEDGTHVGDDVGDLRMECYDDDELKENPSILVNNCGSSSTKIVEIINEGDTEEEPIVISINDADEI